MQHRDEFEWPPEDVEGDGSAYGYALAGVLLVLVAICVGLWVRW